MLLPVYVQLDPRYREMVHTLGGGRWQTFCAAEWPWVKPVLLESGLIIFAFVFAAFEVPHLLGVTYPQMLPVLAYDWYFAGDWSRRPMALSAMVVSTALILTITWLMFRLLHRKRWVLMKGRER